MTTAVSHTLNFYPRPPRGGRQMHHWECITRQLISIHALREEGDRFKRDYSLLTTIFLSTPSARRATGQEGVYQHRKEFLSTPSARRATPPQFPLLLPFYDFYPRPPRGGRPCPAWPGFCVCCYFYPRPPRGGRPFVPSNCLYYTKFLSTPSARRATVQHGQDFAYVVISIHALREEGDRCSFVAFLSLLIFLSTPSARRATIDQQAEIDSYLISIHALREEGDPSTSCDRHSKSNFYPRPPRGGRPIYADQLGWAIPISIHALREEGDSLDYATKT